MWPSWRRRSSRPKTRRKRKSASGQAREAFERAKVPEDLPPGHWSAERIAEELRRLVGVRELKLGYLRKLRSELRLTPEAVHPSARATRKRREEGRFFTGAVKFAPDLLVGGKAATPAKTAPGARHAPCTGRRPKNSAKEAGASFAGCSVSPSFKVQLLERGHLGNLRCLMTFSLCAL